MHSEKPARPLNSFHGNSIPFSSLVWRKWELKPLSSFPSRAVYGFDTETLDGWCKLITCSDGRVLKDGDIDDILSFLTYRQCRGAHNFFYNIDYDMDAILKFLDTDTLKTLLETGEADYEKYHIKMIAGKFYTFTLSKHRYSFYDLWQFYDSSLEVAARKYLGEEKYTIPLDRVQIGNSASYWQTHSKDIETYCLNDARLTKALGEALQREAITTFQFTPKHYVSKAGLSKQYFRHRCLIPDTRQIPKPAMAYAFQAYHGGRFEVTERGNVGQATAIDINSAYPYQISNLLDVTKGEWRHVHKRNTEATYGFYACRVSHHYAFLPLLPLKLWGQTFYPYGEWNTFLTGDEIDELRKVGSVDVIRGWEFYAGEEIYPFREAIEHLYKAKSTAKKGSYQYSLYKIVMNALYGAFYEKVLLPDGNLRVGSLFNPVYATLITSRTRLDLYREARKYGRNAVCLATDGILVKGKTPLTSSNELGAFSIKETGESIILRSGIYTIAGDTKQRGMIKATRLKTPFGEFNSIFDYITAFPDRKQYPVLINRPIHLREAIRHCKKYTKEDINRFMSLEMSFDLNTEIKRVFERSDLIGRDLLEGSVKSQPWRADTLLSHHKGREKG